jgi:hypothetical protein
VDDGKGGDEEGDAVEEEKVKEEFGQVEDKLR